MKLILTFGCPATFNWNWEEPNDNKQQYIQYQYGNEPSIAKNPEPVSKTLNKEEKIGRIIPFEWWINNDNGYE